MTWFPNRVMKAEKEKREYYSTKFCKYESAKFFKQADICAEVYKLQIRVTYHTVMLNVKLNHEYHYLAGK